MAGVEPLELHAGVVCGELPVGLCMMLVAVVLPGGDFFFEGRLVWNAAAQTLARQDAEFGFGHVEPASVFGGGWIPTRSATPSTALVPQRKVGFPIPNAGLLLGFQGT